MAFGNSAQEFLIKSGWFVSDAQFVRSVSHVPTTWPNTSRFIGGIGSTATWPPWATARPPDEAGCRRTSSTTMPSGHSLERRISSSRMKKRHFETKEYFLFSVTVTKCNVTVTESKRNWDLFWRQLFKKRKFNCFYLISTSWILSIFYF